MKQYIVDAFTDRPFTGNPAAVCILDRPLSDARMQQIAAENNIAETAFVHGQSYLWSLVGSAVPRMSL